MKLIRDAELFDDNAKPEVISRKRVLPRDVALDQSVGLAFRRPVTPGPESGHDGHMHMMWSVVAESDLRRLASVRRR